jgi:hypothetical protein
LHLQIFYGGEYFTSKQTEPKCNLGSEIIQTPVGSHAVEQKRPALDGSSSENRWHRAINAALDTWNELVEKKNLEVTKLVGVAPGNYEDQMVMYC